MSKRTKSGLVALIVVLAAATALTLASLVWSPLSLNYRFMQSAAQAQVKVDDQSVVVTSAVNPLTKIRRGYTDYPLPSLDQPGSHQIVVPASVGYQYRNP